ncbi:MAG TPA: hypothetical protein PLE19_14915 [Planctomycetota bacterium]|nr:hypothetical protein [Planctomycetota bacterium]HRR82271.1 hypothetical protein [Planctomycetota bacterium]HRT97636.1 hypothetical protein [Planctomycetota bacterium]
MLANREGRFRARVTDRGVNSTGPNKLCTVILRFALTEEYRDGEWHDITAEDLEVVAYFYVEKRDGTLNEFIIDALKEALGWPGIDPFWFEDEQDLPPVQLTLEWDEYEGKKRIRVRYLNPHDAEPSTGISHADANERRALSARLGCKLRAYSGGTAVPAPKPAGAPAPPPKRAAAPPQAKKTATMDETWTLFAEWAKKVEADEGRLHDEWFAAIKAVCGHEDAERVTPEQWAEVQAKVPDCPF